MFGMFENHTKCPVCSDKKEECKYHEKRNFTKIPPRANYIVVAHEESERGEYTYIEYGDNGEEDGKAILGKSNKQYQPSDNPVDGKRKTGRYNNILWNLQDGWYDNLENNYKNDAVSMFLRDALPDVGWDNSIVLANKDLMVHLYSIYLDIVCTPSTQDSNDLFYLDIGHIRFYNLYKFCGVLEPNPTTFFPLCLNSPRFYNLKEIPAEKYFYDIHESVTTRQAKSKFYASTQNEEWKFKEAARDYLKKSTELILERGIKVQNMTYNLQEKLHKITSKKDILITSPFNFNSMVQFMFAVETNYCYDDVRIVQYESTGVPTGNSSGLQRDFELYIQFLNPGKNIRSAYCSPNGAKVLKHRLCVDSYIEEGDKITIYELNGCRFHICPNENCKSHKKRTADQRALLEDKSEARKLILQQIYNISDTNQKIYSECEFRELMKEKKFKDFLKGLKYPKGVSMKRLIPRDCVFGALNEVFAHRWMPEIFGCETKLVYVDFNSQYSNIGRTCKFPTGPYERWIETQPGEPITKVTKDGFFFNDNEELECVGSAMVDVLPPQDQLYPFLLYRTSSGKVIGE